VVLATVVLLGLTSCSGEDSSESEEGSSSASSSEAKKAEAVLNAGLEAQTAGDLTAAAEQYEKTLELDPDNKFALYNLALIDEASQNYGLAEEHYRAALKADPAYQPALFNLAILRTQVDPEEAVSLYRKAVAAKKTDAASWLNLGLLLRAAGDTQEGNQAVARAIELDPKLTDPAE